MSSIFSLNSRYEELCRKENSEMVTLLYVQQDDLLSGNEEAAELAQEAPVSCGGSLKFVGTTLWGVVLVLPYRLVTRLCMSTDRGPQR